MHVFGARSLIWKKPIIWPILSGNGIAILHEMPCSKGKRTSIATFRDHYSAIAILLNPLVFHCILPLKVPDLIELYTARFLFVTRLLHARWWCTIRCNSVALLDIVHVYFVKNFLRADERGVFQFLPFTSTNAVADSYWLKYLSPPTNEKFLMSTVWFSWVQIRDWSLGS